MTQQREDVMNARNLSNFFNFGNKLPPTPSLSISDEPEPINKGSGFSAPHKALVGRTEPRLVTPVIPSETFGPLVAAWAEAHLGKTLMKWQRIALDGQLRYTDAGLVHREALISTARQNGKTVGLMALIGWYLTEAPAIWGMPLNVLSTAHKLDRASAIFRELAPVLEVKFGAKPEWSYGRQALTMQDGSRWEVRAATPQNAHGASNDLIVVDEVWNVNPAVLFDALRPSMIARPSPLLSMWSTAGDDGSTALLLLREQALNQIDRKEPGKLFFCEWSPPPGVNVLEDRQWWPWANPALGTTITEDALQAALQSPDKQSVLRAHMNLWIASSKSWIPGGTWDQLQVDEMPAGGWLCIDHSVDESRYAGLRAAVRDDGLVVAKVEFVVDTEAKMWEQVDHILTDPQVRLAVTPTLAVHCPVKHERRMTQVGYGELQRFTPLVKAMIQERRLGHLGETLLAEHVNRAVGVRTQGTFVVSSQKSPGPIELCRCMIFAAALASKPGSQIKKPLAAFG